MVFTHQDKGAKHVLIHRERLECFLQLGPTEVKALDSSHLLSPLPVQTAPRPRIDYQQLAGEYSRLLTSGTYATKAALARHLGVSRAWVGKFLNHKNAKSADDDFPGSDNVPPFLPLA